MALLDKRWRTRLLSLLGVVLASMLVVGELPGTRLAAQALSSSAVLCYGGGTGDDNPVVKKEATDHFYMPSDNDIQLAPCSSWRTDEWYYYQVSDGNYGNAPERNLDDIKAAIDPNAPTIQYRLVIDSPFGRPQPFQDKGADNRNRYHGPVPTASPQIPVEPMPEVIERPAPMGTPEPLPSPFSWAAPAAAPYAQSECTISSNGKPLPTWPDPCFFYKDRGRQALNTPPQSILEPGSSNPYVAWVNLRDPNLSSNPNFKWLQPLPSPLPSPQWLDTGRTTRHTSPETKPTEAPPNISVNSSCRDNGGDLPCFDWVQLNTDTVVGNSGGSYLSQANVVRAPNPNNPVLLYTVRGFFYDPVTMQLVEFEKRNVPSDKDNPSKADLKLLFVTRLTEAQAIRPDIADDLAMIFPSDRFPGGNLPPPTFKRVNLGGAGGTDNPFDTRETSTPPPSDAPTNDLILWSKRNQAPVTTNFKVTVSGNMATVKLGVARPNKRPTPIETIDPITGEKRVIGQKLPDLRESTGAGDISAEDTTSFAIRGR